MCVAIPAIGLATAASTMAASSLAASVAGAGVAAYGAMQQGRAASDAAKYQSKVAKNNAKVSAMMAQDALDRGSIEEDRQRKKTGLIIGAQRAAMAGQGTELGFGSPLDITGDAAAAGELDALTIRQNASREAWAFKNQQAQFMSDASASRYASGQSKTAARIGAGANLLAGASQVGNQWAGYKSAGVWG